MALDAILTAIVTAIATEVDGEAPYTHDLSADGAVRKGRRVQAGARPEAHVYNPTEQFTREGQPLGLVRSDTAVLIDGHLGSKDYDPDARYSLATTLKDDIVRALMTYGVTGAAQPTLGGLVYDLAVNGAVMEAEDGTPFARVNVTWWTRSTTGV